MVHLPGGTFTIGFNGGHDDERPVHLVRLKPFLMDRHEVTNRQFAEFVAATGYVTQAERDGYAWVYKKGADDFQALHGANWRHPEGPGSAIEQHMDHPVVCVSWHDAVAYARWAGKRLPTEAEWEYAARGGTESHFVADVVPPSLEAHGAQATKHTNGLVAAVVGHHPAGSLHQSGHARKSVPCCIGSLSKAESKTAVGEVRVPANTWQGTWPDRNELSDGFFYTAPVGRYGPNRLGLHNMIGNVWEWTGDWYDTEYYQHSPSENPTGPQTGKHRVARGGSWFCSPNYCGAYSTHYRGSSPPGYSFNNVGFRCAKDVDDERSPTIKKTGGTQP